MKKQEEQEKPQLMTSFNDLQQLACFSSPSIIERFKVGFKEL